MQLTCLQLNNLVDSAGLLQHTCGARLAPTAAMAQLLPDAARAACVCKAASTRAMPLDGIVSLEHAA